MSKLEVDMRCEIQDSLGKMLATRISQTNSQYIGDHLLGALIIRVVVTLVVAVV